MTPTSSPVRMTMTRLMLIGDVHLADRPPSVRTETYAQDVLDKLTWAMTLARGYPLLDAIILAGDVFHIKAPSRTSHELVQATADVLTSAGLPVWVVPGNHDLSHDRLESLSKQPLGTLAKVDGIDLLIGPHPTLPVFGLPWLHDYPSRLPVWMRRYVEWADKRKAEDLDFFPLMVTHAPIFPPGEDPPYEYIPAEDWAEFMLSNGACFYGHIHDPHGVYETSFVTFCNNGAISRGSLHEQTLKRKPAVTIFDGRDFERIEVPHRPVEAVFRLREKEDVDARASRAEAFLQSIGETKLEALTVESVLEASQKLAPLTRQVVQECIEEVVSR